MKPIRVVFTGHVGRLDGLEDHLDLVMESLVAAEGNGLRDFDLSANLDTGDVEIEVIAEGRRIEDAVGKALVAIRSAILGAGGEVSDDDLMPDDPIPERFRMAFTGSRQEPVPELV